MAAPQQIPQAAVGSTVAGARDVVSVACKLPNGFILREFAPSKESEQVMGGGAREVTVHRQTGRQVEIKGVAYRLGTQPPILVNGYRITRDVPRDLWNNWHAANKDSDLVRNHIVFADAKHDDVKAWSREHEMAETGLEGIDPDAPGKRVRGVERADKPK